MLLHDPFIMNEPLQSTYNPNTITELSWFNPSQQLSTMQLLPPPTSQWDGEEDQGKKSKTHGLR